MTVREVTQKFANTILSFGRGFTSKPCSDLPGIVHRPRRALLYVPGNDERKIRKAATELSVDVVCMDCEDAVAASQKNTARNCVVQQLETLTFGESERAVRINSLGSGLADADLEAVLSSDTLPDALVIPKVCTSVDLRTIVPKVKKILRHNSDKLEKRDNPLKLITMCESAMGLLNLREVLDSAMKLGLLGHTGSPLRLEACILGGDDFAASVGAARTRQSAELLFARQCFLTHCRAYGLQPIDVVQISYKDDSLLRHEAAEGAQMGFEGKQIIHPAQAGIVQEVFSPSAGAVQSAEELVAAFEEHQRSGRGAFVFKGQMVDNPTVLQARNVLARAAACAPRAGAPPSPPQ